MNILIVYNWELQEKQFGKKLTTIRTCSFWDETITTIAYDMTPGRNKGTPSRSYLQTIADGYAEFGFPKKLLFDAAVAAESAKQK